MRREMSTGEDIRIPALHPDTWTSMENCQSQDPVGCPIPLHISEVCLLGLEWMWTVQTAYSGNLPTSFALDEIFKARVVSGDVAMSAGCTACSASGLPVRRRNDDRSAARFLSGVVRLRHAPAVCLTWLQRRPGDVSEPTRPALRVRACRRRISMLCRRDISQGCHTALSLSILKLKLETNLYSAINSEDSEALDGGTSQLSRQREYGEMK